MSYIVIELQTNAEGQTANLVYAYDNLPQAMSKYHAILSAAAVSSVAHHAALVIDETGVGIARECYEHQAASA